MSDINIEQLNLDDILKDLRILYKISTKAF